jgi:hypothetical protein
MLEFYYIGRRGRIPFCLYKGTKESIPPKMLRGIFQAAHNQGCAVEIVNV